MIDLAFLFLVLPVILLFLPRSELGLLTKLWPQHNSISTRRVNDLDRIDEGKNEQAERESEGERKMLVVPIEPFSSTCL